MLAVEGRVNGIDAHSKRQLEFIWGNIFGGDGMLS